MAGRRRKKPRARPRPGQQEPTRSDESRDNSGTRHTYHLRSRNEKILGVTLVVAGLAVVLLNYLSEIDASLTYLPGGHLEVYFLGGLIAAGFGVWHTGVLDRQ